MNTPRHPWKADYTGVKQHVGEPEKVEPPQPAAPPSLIFSGRYRLRNGEVADVEPAEHGFRTTFPWGMRLEFDENGCAYHSGLLFDSPFPLRQYDIMERVRDAEGQ